MDHAHKVFDGMSRTEKWKQNGTVQEYYDSFMIWVQKTGMNESYVIDFFVSGLHPEIEKRVKMFEPKSLSDAYRLAHLQEKTNEVMKRKTAINNKTNTSLLFFSNATEYEITGSGATTKGLDGSGTGSQSSFSGMGWTKCGKVVFLEERVSETQVSKDVNYPEIAVSNGGGTGMLPSAEFPSTRFGEDFLSLHSSTGPEQRHKTCSLQKPKQLVSKITSHDLKNSYQFSLPVQIQLSHCVINDMNENSEQSLKSRDVFENHVWKKEDILPLIKLNSKTDWDDDERGTCHELLARVLRDQEKLNSETSGNINLNSSVYDKRDLFEGNLVGVLKRKKEVRKQTVFYDPVRELFEVELEKVQKIQEMERKFKCSKQEAERANVACKSDLDQAKKTLIVQKYEQPPTVPPKLEENGGSLTSIASNQLSSASVVILDGSSGQLAHKECDKKHDSQFKISKENTMLDAVDTEEKVHNVNDSCEVKDNNITGDFSKINEVKTNNGAEIFNKSSEVEDDNSVKITFSQNLQRSDIKGIPNEQPCEGFFHMECHTEMVSSNHSNTFRFDSENMDIEAGHFKESRLTIADSVGVGEFDSQRVMDLCGACEAELVESYSYLPHGYKCESILAKWKRIVVKFDIWKWPNRKKRKKKDRNLFYKSRE